MDDIFDKHLMHWLAGAGEDLWVGRDLIARGRPRHGLFFVHLALEKVLKTQVCRATGEYPPKIDNLVRLSELLGVCPTQEHMKTFTDMDVLNQEGCYSEPPPSPPTPSEIQDILARVEEVWRWLHTL